MTWIEAAAEAVRRLFALAALTGAVELLLREGPAKRGVELLTRLLAALTVAGMLFQFWK